MYLCAMSRALPIIISYATEEGLEPRVDIVTLRSLTCITVSVCRMYIRGGLIICTCRNLSYNPDSQF